MTTLSTHATVFVRNTLARIDFICARTSYQPSLPVLLRGRGGLGWQKRNKGEATIRIEPFYGGVTIPKVKTKAWMCQLLSVGKLFNLNDKLCLCLWVLQNKIVIMTALWAGFRRYYRVCCEQPMLLIWLLCQRFNNGIIAIRTF